MSIRTCPIIALLAVVMALAMGGALAEPSAFATPARATPGEAILLVFTLPAEAVVEASVLEEISCTITGAGIEAIDCATVSRTVEARLQGEDRTYAFEIAAPTTPGIYVATLTRESALTVAVPPGEAESVQTSFEIIQAGTPAGVADLTPGSTDLGSDATIDGSFLTAGGDGLRWLASVWLAAGATLASVVVARRGGGLE